MFVHEHKLVVVVSVLQITQKRRISGLLRSSSSLLQYWIMNQIKSWNQIMNQSCVSLSETKVSRKVRRAKSRACRTHRSRDCCGKFCLTVESYFFLFDGLDSRLDLMLKAIVAFSMYFSTLAHFKCSCNLEIPFQKLTINFTSDILI